MKKILEDYRTPFIPNKQLLARRLAQCLNPIWPIGVHQKSLEIYSLVFSNLSLGGLSWAEDLGMFSMGLFPFLRYCSVQLKPEMVQIINDHYLPLGSQIAICLPALVPSVLLLIEENDEKIRIMATTCVDSIVGICGSKLVNGCIFMGLLRNPSYRMALLKYVNTAKKEKKSRVQKDLSVIPSEGANEDVESQFRHLEDDKERVPVFTKQIKSLLGREMLAGKL